MSAVPNPRQILLDYVNALSARDLAAVEALLCAHSLFEIPFIKPNRLVGLHEISSAHGDMFRNLESIEFTFEHTLCDHAHALAEGQLRVQRDNRRSEFIAAVAVVLVDNQLQRLSLYCDARNQRLWSDRSIF